MLNKLMSSNSNVSIVVTMGSSIMAPNAINDFKVLIDNTKQSADVTAIRLALVRTFKVKSGNMTEVTDEIANVINKGGPSNQKINVELEVQTPAEHTEPHMFNMPDGSTKYGSFLAPSYEGQLFSIAYHYELRIWHEKTFGGDALTMMQIPITIVCQTPRLVIHRMPKSQVPACVQQNNQSANFMNQMLVPQSASQVQIRPQSNPNLNQNQFAGSAVAQQFVPYNSNVSQPSSNFASKSEVQVPGSRASAPAASSQPYNAYAQMSQSPNQMNNNIAVVAYPVVNDNPQISAPIQMPAPVQPAQPQPHPVQPSKPQPQPIQPAKPQLAPVQPAAASYIVKEIQDKPKPNTDAELKFEPIAPLDMNGIQIEEEKKDEQPIINATNLALNMGGWQMPEHMVVNIPPDDRQTTPIVVEDFGGPTGEDRPTWEFTATITEAQP